MEIFVTNSVGKVKTATFEGRDYFVAPLTMIVPGVLPGSKGPLLYPPDEVAKNPGVWNGTLITLRHPVDASNKPLALKDNPGLYHGDSTTPGIGLGFVRNDHVKDGKRAGEGWFDVLHTTERAPVVAEFLRNAMKGDTQTKMELSTGLQTTDEATSGVGPDGRPYTAIARNYVPDHLAILPDQIGACSVRDGCGLLVNAEQVQEYKGGTLKPYVREWPLPPSFSATTTNAEVSHETVRECLRNAIRSTFTQDQPTPYIYDVFDTYMIYEANGKMFKQSYSKSATGTVTLSGNPVAVRQEVSYVTVNSTPSETSTMPLTPEQKTAIVTKLTTNCDCWKGDEKTLNAFPDDKLVKLDNAYDTNKANAVVVNAVKETFGAEIVTNATPASLKTAAAKLNPAPIPVPVPVPTPTPTPAPIVNKQLTLDEWKAITPPDVLATFNSAAEIVKNAKEAEAAEKTRLVANLTSYVENANDRKALSDKYMGWSLDVLRTMAQRDAAIIPQRQASYIGAGGYAPTVNIGADDDASDVLQEVVVNEHKDEIIDKALGRR